MKERVRELGVKMTRKYVKNFKKITKLILESKYQFYNYKSMKIDC